MTIARVDGFKGLNNHLLEITDFFDPGPVQTIDFDWEDKQFLEKLRVKIAAGGKKLSTKYPYWEGYVEPLLSKDLDDIIWKLAEQIHQDAVSRPVDPTIYAMLTLLVNAAIQPAEPEVAEDIQSLQSIVTEMFTSFLTARQKLGAEGDLDHTFPPLVGYIGHLPSNVKFKPPLPIPLPCTLELEQLRDSYLLGPQIGGRFKLGAMGLSAGYRNHPLMWGIVGHELGGHYCLTADKDDKLVEELQDKIYAMLQDKYPRSPLNVAAPLWRFWVEEAAADVCCVLNLGPHAAIGAVAFFTALLPLAGWTTTSLLSQRYTNNEWDMHPIPVLIPHLISGAVDGLLMFTDERKRDSVKLITEIGAAYTGTSDVVAFPKYSKVYHPNDRRQPPIDLPDRALPLKAMQNIAHDVGQYIATVKLEMLNKRALRDLEMAWNDGDEDNALIARDKFMEKNSWDFMIKGTKAKNRHLLAGGLLAVMQNHELYDNVSHALRTAFAKNEW